LGWLNFPIAGAYDSLRVRVIRAGQFMPQDPDSQRFVFVSHIELAVSHGQ
jgi:hypothetical protein